MILYQKGNQMAFEVLYTRHKNKVYTYLSKRLYNKNDLNDLFQQVFIKLHKSRFLYIRTYDFLPWLYTIARSEFLDHIKKSNTNNVVINVDEGNTEVSTCALSEIEIDLESSLNRNEKEALKRRYYSDQDFSEIAIALQTSQANIRKIISRAIQKLRKKYNRDANDE